MNDIDTVWDNVSGRGDYALAGADLRAGHELMTAILISLFSDRLADISDALPDASNDRRGWWGDAGETFLIGSRLWLLDRAKLDPSNQNSQVQLQAQQYITEALQWMIDDGIVAAFDIATEVRYPGTLFARVKALRSANGVTATGYGWTWQGNVLYAPGQESRQLVIEDGTIIVI